MGGKSYSTFLLLLLCVNISFAQSTLNYFIETAQKNSPLINDNLNQSTVNTFEAERLKALYTKPQIGVTANYLFAPIIAADNGKPIFEANPSSGDKYFGYDLAANNGGEYQALLTITQPLFNGKRYKVAKEQLDATSKINENTAKITAHDIEKLVTDQYVLCIQDRMQLQYASSMYTLLNEQKEILKKLVENGIYKQSDLALVNIEFQSFASQLVTFNANYRRDFLDLNIICGINDTTIVQLQSTNLSLAESVDNSAYLEKYRLDSLNLVSQQKMFELKYKPQLNFLANAGLNAVYAPTIPSRFGLSAGISLSYSFFDGGQKKFNSNKIATLQKSVSFYKENFVNQNTVRKTKILNELQSYNDRISIAQQQLKDYETLVNTYKKELVSGQLSVTNYIMTLKNMALVQRDYVLLFAQQQLLINTYNYWNW